MFFLEGNEPEDIPATERIPVELMKPFLNKRHILYTGNFYASPMLASFLLKNQTYLCDTVKRNCRDYYIDISNVILEEDTASFYQTSNVNNQQGQGWQGRRRLARQGGNKPKVVFMLLTFHNPFMVDTGKVDRDENHIMKRTMV